MYDSAWQRTSNDKYFSFFLLFQFNLIIPVTFLVFVIFLLIVPMVAVPRETGIGLLITCSGIPVYYIGIVWKSKPKSFLTMMSM